MSGKAGPSIVTNGLVLSLDASDKNSYTSGSTTWYNLNTNITGTLINGPIFNSSNQGYITFDGTNDYVGCGDVIKGRTTFSAESWIKTVDNRTGANSSYMNPSIFGTQHGSGVSGDFAITVKNGKFGFYHELTGSYGYIDTNLTIADNKWHHVCVTKTTAGLITLYLDGNAVYSGSGYTSSIRTADLQYYNWELGRAYWYGEDANMLRYSGSIANHLLYDRELSASEVLQNYKAIKGRFGL